MSSADVETEPFPTRLYEEARRRLLANAPLRADSAPGGTGLTAGEASALESAGLSNQPWVTAQQDDPLQQSIADYMALLETSLTVGEVAAYLHVDVSRIRQRVRERSLFGVDYEGEYRLPLFQLERGRVLPGLREVLAALPESLNPLDVAEWFLASNPDLESETQAKTLSPRQWLLSGAQIEPVLRLARVFA